MSGNIIHPFCLYHIYTAMITNQIRASDRQQGEQTHIDTKKEILSETGQGREGRKRMSHLQQSAGGLRALQGSPAAPRPGERNKSATGCQQRKHRKPELELLWKSCQDREGYLSQSSDFCLHNIQSHGK